jgi:AraC family transcriptional regulator of arabinose operon
VLKYLNTHYREAVTIQELAHQVSLSPSRLAHLFKQEVGRSIIETLIAIRLQQAARLLEYTSLHINEIAREVGFQSASYLSRQFAAYYGHSPQAYRQQRATLLPEVRSRPDVTVVESKL